MSTTINAKAGELIDFITAGQTSFAETDAADWLTSWEQSAEGEQE